MVKRRVGLLGGPFAQRTVCHLIFNLRHSFIQSRAQPWAVLGAEQDNPKFLPLVELRWEVCGNTRQISKKHFRELRVP